MNLFVTSLFLSSLTSGFGAKKSQESGCRSSFSNAIKSKQMTEDIARMLEPCLSDINQPLFGRKMTPLHLAARKGNSWAVEEFLAQGADINQRDANDLSPLLQAAIQGHEYVVNLLLERGADPTIYSKFGGNYADYLRMNAPYREKNEVADSFSSSPISYSAHLVDHLSTNSQCFKKDVVITDENVAEPEVLSLLIEGKSDKHEEAIKVLNLINSNKQLQGFHLESYANYKKNPPSLAIDLVKVTDDGKAIPVKMCGLFAKQSISAGAVVAEYTGELKSSILFTDPTYRADDYPIIDSVKYRSGASMSNHGFPNTRIVYLAEGEFDKGLDGLPFRKLLVAIEDISDGEEIIWDYGVGYELSHQVELRPKALKEFVNSISWKNWIGAFKKDILEGSSIQTALDLSGEFVKVCYFFTNPDALQFAIKNKYLTKKDLDLFKKELKKDPSHSFFKTIIGFFIQKMEVYFTKNIDF